VADSTGASSPYVPNQSYITQDQSQNLYQVSSCTLFHSYLSIVVGIN
jgi:hypothetical protein